MTETKQSDYLAYWGKASRGQSGNYHLLAWHSLDVAACGYVLLKQNRFGYASLLRKLGFSDEEAASYKA